MNFKEYSPDWQDTIRPMILKRDQYKCRVCGIRHRSVVYVNSRKNYTICDEFMQAWAVANGQKTFMLFLNVAHVDCDKSNNDPENLITLCPRHHSLMDAQYKKDRRANYRKKMSKVDGKVAVAFAADRAAVLREISASVKSFTGTGIHLHEAEIILTITSKYNGNNE